jgi:hypothetical protein
MEQGESADLVMAMPRRELFRIQGFVPPNDLAILESLAEESWFAAPSVLRGDFDAKEVRIGLVMRSANAVLIDGDGVLLHVTPIPPEVGQLGTSCLASLRNLALAAGRALLNTANGRVELSGFCNEDALQECQGVFLLIYRFQLAEPPEAPAGMRWLDRTQLAAEPIDPVSALVLDAAR